MSRCITGRAAGCQPATKKTISTKRNKSVEGTQKWPPDHATFGELDGIQKEIPWRAPKNGTQIQKIHTPTHTNRFNTKIQTCRSETGICTKLWGWKLRRHESGGVCGATKGFKLPRGGKLRPSSPIPLPLARRCRVRNKSDTFGGLRNANRLRYTHKSATNFYWAPGLLIYSLVSTRSLAISGPITW